MPDHESAPPLPPSVRYFIYSGFSSRLGADASDLGGIVYMRVCIQYFRMERSVATRPSRSSVLLRNFRNARATSCIVLDGVVLQAPKAELPVKQLVKRAVVAAREKGGKTAELDQKVLKQALRKRLKDGKLKKVTVTDDVAVYGG